MGEEGEAADNEVALGDAELDDVQDGHGAVVGVESERQERIARPEQRVVQGELLMAMDVVDH